MIGHNLGTSRLHFERPLPKSFLPIIPFNKYKFSDNLGHFPQENTSVKIGP